MLLKKATTQLYKVNYTYYDSSQINTITSNTNPEWNGLKLTYDNLYRMTKLERTVAPTYVKNFAYDDVGNMTLNDGVAQSYMVNMLPHAVSQVGGDEYRYDDNGNLVSVIDPTGPDCLVPKRFLTWDAEDRLSNASAGAVTTFYAYDGDRERIKKHSGNSTTLYFGNLLEIERNGSKETWTKYYYADDLLLAQRRGTSLEYVHQDHLDSVRTLMSTAGQVVGSRQFTAYGAQTAGPTDKGHRGYGAHWLDDETGLLYMGARYYDPAIGRFIQPDTVVPEKRDLQSWNSYSFVRNNPLNRVDPTGNQDEAFSTLDDPEIVRVLGENGLGPAAQPEPAPAPEPPTQTEPDNTTHPVVDMVEDAIIGALSGGDVYENSFDRKVRSQAMHDAVKGSEEAGARIVELPSKRAARRAAEREAGMGKNGARKVLPDQELRPGSRSPRGAPGRRTEVESVDTGRRVHHDPYGHRDGNIPRTMESKAQRGRPTTRIRPNTIPG